MKILIIMEGGIVSHVVADAPVEVLTIDYDTDGDSADEVVPVPQDDGAFADAYITDPMVDVNPARTSELFALA